MSLYNAFGLIGGLGLFIYGINVMSKGLEKVAGDRLKRWFEILTSKVLLGVLVGALITAIVQSSSATTVMVVGFVNAGLMTLKQAAGVIMGANIGTTITAFFVALNLTDIAPIFAGIGAFLTLFGGSKRSKQIGEIMLGFGLLFIGVRFMSTALRPLKDVQAFIDIVESFSVNPFLGVVAGILLTVLLQSSSASIAVLQSLAIAGAIPMESALPILFGQNIGTCVTAMLSSIGASVTAKRAAYVHLMFNVIGTAIFLGLIYGLGAIMAKSSIDGVNPIASLFLSLNPGDVPQQIANTHIIFNVTNTFMLLPFSGWLVSISAKLVKSSTKVCDTEFRFIDERFLESPIVAIANATKEIVRMGKLAQTNYNISIESFFNKDEKRIQEAYEREKAINQLEKDITDYLIKLSNKNTSISNGKIINGLYHTLNDIERIGDHAENLLELAEYSIANNLNFTEQAYDELRDMNDLINSILDKSLESLSTEKFDLAREALVLEDTVDKMEKDLRENHIDRLNNFQCNANSGIVFLDIISNLERIADHCSNISLSVLDLEKKH